MRQDGRRKRWQEARPALGGWLSLPSAFTAEVMAPQGLDWLCVDMQHGLIDYETALAMLQAISTTATTPLVRVPWNDQAIIMKMLDAGAYGVIVPMVNTRADAEAAVAACRYAPRGRWAWPPPGACPRRWTPRCPVMSRPASASSMPAGSTTWRPASTPAPS